MILIAKLRLRRSWPVPNDPNKKWNFLNSVDFPVMNRTKPFYIKRFFIIGMVGVGFYVATFFTGLPGNFPISYCVVKSIPGLDFTFIAKLNFFGVIFLPLARSMDYFFSVPEIIFMLLYFQALRIFFPPFFFIFSNSLRIFQGVFSFVVRIFKEPSFAGVPLIFFCPRGHNGKLYLF
jgi:hypothetical protein